ncbi:hypothetical protein K438DRAFT_1230131 [Mycena galopus ATCC 62051]|nr:hypothetical protein K438DRAFT_1230131 [Mycena galopus ATCC 62051]
MSCRPFAARTLARKTRSTRCFSALPKPKPTSANDTLLLLEKTAALVPQILPEDRAWDGVLSTTLADLRSYHHSRPARLVVCGTEGAGARDLVTALLEAPFINADQARSLRERWANAPEQKSLTIEYGSSPAEDSLRLPLAYLDQFQVPLQVIEGADPALLQTADVPVLVTTLNELRTLRLTRPDTLVVLNIEETDTNTAQPRASTSRASVAPSKYFFVSPSQAVSALAVVRDSTGPDAVQRYQTAFLASRMPTLTQALHAVLASMQDASTLRNRTALGQIRGALAACRFAIQDAREELDRIASGVSTLNALVEEERVKVQRDVFGSADDHAVDRALVDATAMMKMKIDHMHWRRSMFAIDELTTYLTSTVQRIWCQGLEKELIFHAGRLANMQRAFTARAFELLAPSNTRALHSPVLHNALRQLTAAPTFPIQPGTLMAPLAARSQLIINAPTARLHVAAQRAMFGLGGATITGMGISWAGNLGYFIGANGLMGSFILEPATAMATGILIAVGGVHWSMWKWNKARARWWEDFTRVANGAKQDITDTLDRTMEDQVLVAARTGCSELSKKLGERKTELDLLQERLDALSTAADQLEQRK